MNLLPRHGFVASYIHHLETVGSLNYVVLLNADICHYRISKIGITTDFIRKVFKYRRAVKFMVVGTSSLDFNFHLKSWILLMTNPVSFFFFKGWAFFIDFWKNIFQIPKSEWLCFVCHSFFEVTMIFHNESSSSVLNSNSCNCAFLWGNHLMLVSSRSSSCVFALWCHRMLRDAYSRVEI